MQQQLVPSPLPPSSLANAVCAPWHDGGRLRFFTENPPAAATP